MDIQSFQETFPKSKLVREIAEEFGISPEIATKRILAALQSSDFSDQILDPLKIFLNKIDYLEDAGGKIDIINMDTLKTGSGS